MYMRTILYDLYLLLRAMFGDERQDELYKYLSEEEQEQLFNIYLKIKTQIFGNDD